MQIELNPSEIVLVYVSLARRKAEIQSLADNPFVSPETRADHARDLEMIQTIGDRLFPSSVVG
jgi:hypothetical protein